MPLSYIVVMGVTGRTASRGVRAVRGGGARRVALTLVECLIATAILGFALLAIVQAVVAGQMQVTDALHRARALEVGEALMDEVLRLPYTDPNGGSELGRANFDDLADFNGFSEAAGALTDAGGTTYGPAFQDFSRTVSVVPANGGGGIAVTGMGAALPGLTITVTVQDSDAAVWTLTSFRAAP